MSTPSTNALYAALVTRLETLTGQTVGNLEGASNYRLLSYLLLLFNSFNGSGTAPVALPRLSATGTADATQALATSPPTSTLYFGPRLVNLPEQRNYSRIEVPLRNVLGTETLTIVVAELVGASWVVRNRQDTALTVGQGLVTIPGPFTFLAGSTWTVQVGISIGDGANNFYGSTTLAYPAPLTNEIAYQTTAITAGVGQTTAIIATTSAQHRVVNLYGVSSPKGVIGPADPADVAFSGTTAQRPTTPVTGQFYFDTTLGKPVYWSGSGWKDATGVAV